MIRHKSYVMARSGDLMIMKKKTSEIMTDKTDEALIPTCTNFTPI